MGEIIKRKENAGCLLPASLMGSIASKFAVCMETDMEKIYKSMKNAGASNIALGIIMIVLGLAIGILTIVNGAKLLKNKSGITF